MLQKNRKSLIRPGALPPVTVLDITTRDKDGELIGRPAEWPEDQGVAPAVAIRQQSPAAATARARRPSPGSATASSPRSSRPSIAAGRPIRRGSSR